MFKVCHLTSVHSASDGRIFEKECTSLSKAKYEVYLVAPNARDEIRNNVSIVGISFENKNRLYRMLFLSRKVYRMALDIDADIYHLHDPELIPYGLKLLKKGKKVIFDSHEDIYNNILDKQYIPLLLRKLISVFYEKYLTYSLKRFTALISVTPHIVEKLLTINSNTYQITNYPIIDTFYPCRKKTHELKELEIVFIGGIHPIWGHENIIQALEPLNRVHYTIIGNAKSSYIDFLSSLKSWDKVSYKGKVPFSQVALFYAKADIGIAVARYENNNGNGYGSLGNTKLFEIMAMGLPVICSDMLLWKNIIDSYKCGICVTPTSIKEITAAIAYLQDNPDVAYQMGLNGRKAVEKVYNWKTQEKVLLKLYKNIM